MNKKVVIQLLLLAVLFGVIISVFFLYFNEEKNIKEIDSLTNEETESEISSETGTLIKDINYSFSDPSGNYYELFSELGEVDIDNSDKMLMTNVTANIYLKNSSSIKIISKYANYNKINHETNFYENVELTHLIHKANSENLDISFKNNTATMYNDVVYKKPGTLLMADRLEIDLISKNTKVLMDNETEKIKIIDNK
tara:strand:+ start:367 stop:957 length:591 start_codon:yes stop_codon:yes gene_type:complete